MKKFTCILAALLWSIALWSQNINTNKTMQNVENRLESIKNYLNSVGKVESVRKVKVDDSELLLVAYVLAPTYQSYIRCAVVLPSPEVWTGRFVGLGNTGYPTGYPENYYNWTEFVASTGCTGHLAGKNNAVAITDMGFSRHREKNPEVWKDFGFRATHLMTVTAKEVIRLYYGKAASYNYFFGLSTGGGQGMHEAQQFPGDYDGIIAVVPASTRLYLMASNLHACRYLYDKDGKKLFADKQWSVVRKAAVKHFANRVPAYAAGKFIPDARYSAEDAGAIARLAGEMDKNITPYMQQQLEKVFAPIYIGNRCAGESFPFGGVEMYNVGKDRLAMLKMFFGEEFDIDKCNIDRDLEEAFRVMSPIFNAENPDLSAFRKRNGKLIVCSGTEDCIVPYAAFREYYQRAIAAAGGVDELKKNFLYYVLPGRSHVRGNGVRRLKDVDQALFDWVEKNIAPTALTGVTTEGVEYPVQPYPQMTVGDAASGYSSVQMPELKTPARDELFTATMTAADALKECEKPLRKINYPAGKVSSWHGYDRYDFTFENRKAFIVAPKNPAPGLPWLWCLQWPTAFVKRTPTFPLLEKGWHYVHIDLHDTAMGIEGIKIADRFYKYLQSMSFDPKAALSGLSIGGLYALRWAAEYPERVSSIYLDAPVTEPVSKTGWLMKRYEKCYQLSGVEALRNSHLTPNNSCPAIAKAKIPVIAIRHGADTVVSNTTNFDVFARNFRAAGGNLTVIDHADYAHHPHGLENPAPLAEFILKNHGSDLANYNEL